VKRALRLSPEDNVYSAVAREIVERVVGCSKEKQRKKEKEFKLTEFSKEVAVELSQAYSCESESVKKLLGEASKKLDEVYESAAKHFDVVCKVELVALSRIAVHTRNPYMPLEIGVAWHPYLNLPYVPSTTIKGALKSYLETCEDSQRICGYEKKELANILFGTTDQRGHLLFTDALPVGCREKEGKDDRPSLVEPDIVTPHYSEIEGVIDEVQAKPKPLVFPTIARGTKLKLVVALRDVKNAQCLASELPNLISKAFELGLGAKTRLGYGVLKVLNASRPACSAGKAR